MSADSITNPPQTESKSARKKKAKAEVAKSEASPAAGTPVDEQAEPLANGETSTDSAHVKELQKNVRNVTKKLNAMVKLDSILAENKGVSLDDLVASRKINNDQREQANRKPGLLASLAQLEEQIVQYRKIDSEYQSRMTSERETLTTSHKTELETLKAQLQQEAESKSQAQLKKKLLIFSQFLRAAAAKRVIEEEAESEESRAFEGVLLLVYGGDEKAVEAAEKLIEGADDAVPSVEGALLSVKYSHIKSAALAYGPFPDEEQELPVEQVSEQRVAGLEDTAASSDPTITHAGLNEDQSSVIPASQPEKTTIPSATIDTGAANAAAEQQWDNQAVTSGATAEESNLDDSFEMIPRNPSETEGTHEKAPPQSTNSWADDATAAAAETSTPAPAVPAVADDGFHEVPARGPRGGANRGQEGRGGRGGRGRGGFRGDGRGRGRGSFRGGEGQQRGRGAPRGGNNAPVRA